MSLQDKFSLAEVALLSLTVLLSFLATRSATRAAKSAEDSYKYTVKTHEKMARPYLGILGTEGVIEGGHWEVLINLENLGQTPARNVQVNSYKLFLVKDTVLRADKFFFGMGIMDLSPRERYTQAFNGTDTINGLSLEQQVQNQDLSLLIKLEFKFRSDTENLKRDIVLKLDRAHCSKREVIHIVTDRDIILQCNHLITEHTMGKTNNYSAIGITDTRHDAFLKVENA